VVSVIRDPRIPESSGLAVSTRYPDLLYTVNDSGNDPVVYVVAEATGKVVGTARLLGVAPLDTEALAIGPDERLYVADIGDNEAVRESVALYALDQPGRGDIGVTPLTYRFRYADGPHDAEALVADSSSGRISVLAKGLFEGAVYELPRSLSPARVMTARRVAGVRLPGLVTDATALPDGGVAVRTYTDVVVYRGRDWQRVAASALPVQRQGESLAASGDGSRLLVGTEGLPSPLHEVAVPRPPRPDQPGSAADPVPEEAVGATGPADSTAWTWAVGAATVVLGSAWLAVRRAQRSRSTT